MTTAPKLPLDELPDPAEAIRILARIRRQAGLLWFEPNTPDAATCNALHDSGWARIVHIKNSGFACTTRFAPETHVLLDYLQRVRETHTDGRFYADMKMLGLAPSDAATAMWCLASLGIAGLVFDDSGHGVHSLWLASELTPTRRLA